MALLTGARRCLGDVYDAGYYGGGPPPRGRGACTDVLWRACLAVGVDLQEAVDSDLVRHPTLYPSRRDRNIDYRWCPNLIVWFKRNTRALPHSLVPGARSGWQPGDIVFWSMLGDSVADHCGVISDRLGPRGLPHVIHNLGPTCTEDDSLSRWMLVGHFRIQTPTSDDRNRGCGRPACW